MRGHPLNKDHFFSVDGVVFVLAVNRSQLAHSIRAVYGSGFDAEGYLRRFFDIDFRLPEAERGAFIETALQRVGIEDYFRNSPEKGTLGNNYESVRDWLVALFVGSDLSLRRVAQSIHRLGLVFASLRKDMHAFALAATVALVMRTLDLGLYERFRSGEAEDGEAIEFLLSRNSRPERSQIDHHLEAVIILAAMELKNPGRDLFGVEPSPLLAKYKELDRARQSGDDAATARASSIVRIIERIRNNDVLGYGGLGSEEAFRRIELLSPSLIDDDSEPSDNSPVD